MFKRKAFVTPFAKKQRVEAATEVPQGIDLDIDLGDAEVKAKPSMARPRVGVGRMKLRSAPQPAEVQQVSNNSGGGGGGAADGSVVYEVNFAKNSSKKHKNWEPGTMECGERNVALKDEDGKVIGKTFKNLREWAEGDTLDVGAYVIEVSGKLASAPEGQLAAPTPAPTPVAPVAKLRTRTSLHGAPPRRPQPASAPAEGSLILKEAEDGTVLAHLPPALAKHLRSHQSEGVRFMYNVTSRPSGNRGVILADEMGLGKTLQCISLIQAHVKNKLSGVKKVVVAVPSSLVGNWAREFRKWLGNNPRSMPTVLSAAEKKDYTVGKIKCFALNAMCHVLILSYEMCRSYSKELAGVRCDMLLCDEGHRLKGLNTQISQALQGIGAARRVLITGTPVQNNIAEFYMLFDFVNPGCLGDRRSYQKEYASHITKLAESGCTADQMDAGHEAQGKLQELTSQYILRRTSADVMGSLPSKTEVLVFFKPSPLQEALYKHILKQVGGPFLDALQSINALKQVLVDTALITGPSAVNTQLRDSCNEVQAEGGAVSAKMAVLMHLLRRFKTDGNKCVVVSSSVKVLDIIAQGLHEVRSVRLDGSVPSARRMELVDRFNTARDVDVMLLSCKAGGVGLNLIGACRLVLVDMDWNPANDLQAVARIWREGQTNPCRIYRMVCRGTIEERILQRQLLKMKLSANMLTEAKDVRTVKPSKYSPDEIRKIFEYKDDKPCITFPSEEGDLEAALQECEEPDLPAALVTYVRQLKPLDHAEHADTAVESDDGTESIPSTPTSVPSAPDMDDPTTEDEAF